MTFNTVPFFHG